MVCVSEMERNEVEEVKWSVKASRGSHNSLNPIRQFEEHLFRDVLREPRSRTDLEFIKLSIGE